MEETQTVTGFQFAQMIHAGTENLRSQAQAINNLNVFPVPDGDTGDNMLLTMIGGSNAVAQGDASIAVASRRAADGMLLSARGNSGVILSQFFDGIARALEGVETADNETLCAALKSGVNHAYNAVMEPVEGTILTVAKKATDYACGKVAKTPADLLKNFLSEAKRTLDKTPEMLPVLKKAGVVDSGGAGLYYIVEGMDNALRDGASYTTPAAGYTEEPAELDLNLFTENDILKYGYCTELLLRLQRVKTDPETFDISTITDFLKKIGDSVVAFKTGSIVKIHVHTMMPDKVLAFCQKFGEFLKIKIENMSLQHNNTTLDGINISVTPDGERKKFAVAAVCSGEGIQRMFSERGADVIVNGGQSMNPSTEDFIEAFKRAKADTVFVLPNNGNVILAAKQAATMYGDADVRVIESRSIGEGYAALSMFCDTGDADSNEQDMKNAMSGTVTAYISQSCRDTSETHSGEYIGFVGKDILVSLEDRAEAAMKLTDLIGIANHDICIVIYGKNVPGDEAETIERSIAAKYPGKEVFSVSGMQEVYDYILILE